MSAESPLSDDFGLIETLLWTRDGGYWLAEGHRDRMAGSARDLGFPFSPEAYAGALAEACAAPEADRLRVRLELRRDGRIDVAIAPFPESEPRVWRVAVAETRLDSRNPLLRHKTTRRSLYEDALQHAQAADSSIDEVVFLNERDEVCEGARTNLFLPRADVMLTPPLSCGLLAGVLRADYLARGAARERILRLDDLGEGFVLGNALRGVLPARLCG